MRIQPGIHIVKETSVGRMFRRLLNFPDIFTYWNVETAQWILCYWVKKSARLCHELEDLGSHMELVTQPFVKQIVSCWKPVDWGKKKKMLLSREKSRKNRTNDAKVDENDRWKWMKKRVGDKAPIPFMYNAGR